MKSLDFWRAVTVDETDFLGRVLGWLESAKVRFCVIGGQGVNAYVEPLVSLDLDLAIAAEDLDALLARPTYDFEIERFEHRVNLRQRGSDLRVQFQLDPRYAAVVDRAEPRDVLGRRLPVARLEDLVDGKVWAASDPSRRPSKRLKDLADLARLLERYPELAARIPAEIRSRLL
jgi:hypothetical protein